MSTKIYGGFKLVGFDNLNQAYYRLDALRGEMYQKATRLFLAQFARETISRADMQYFGCGKDTRSPVSMIFEECCKGEEEVKLGRRSLWDFSFEISLFPQNEAIYGIAFSECAALRKLWLKQPYVKDYGYWNNTDEPDDLPRGEWETRALVWDRLLHKGKLPMTPEMRGICMTFVPEGMIEIPHIEKLVKHKMKASDRAKWVVENVLCNNFMKNKPVEMDDIFGRFRDFNQWLRTPEGGKAFVKMMPSVLKRLPKVTVEYLGNFQGHK